MKIEVSQGKEYGYFKNRPSKQIERLVRKIEKDIDIRCDAATFKRTYRGYWGRRQGAFSWTMQTIPSADFHTKTVCSINTVNEILKSKNPLVIQADNYMETEIILDE